MSHGDAAVDRKHFLNRRHARGNPVTCEMRIIQLALVTVTDNYCKQVGDANLLIAQDFQQTNYGAAVKDTCTWMHGTHLLGRPQTLIFAPRAHPRQRGASANTEI